MASQTSVISWNGVEYTAKSPWVVPVGVLAGVLVHSLSRDYLAARFGTPVLTLRPLPNIAWGWTCTAMTIGAMSLLFHRVVDK